ncbi:MAG: 50S ribosomal protein L11 methyltransferase [Bacillota bacterium]|nr:50S ribosomal protein L11 methyltransferase [Bacillota bacterium]
MIYKKITLRTQETERASACFLMLGAEGTELISSTEEDLQCFQFDYLDMPHSDIDGVAASFVCDSENTDMLLLSDGSRMPLEEFLGHLKGFGFEEIEVLELDSADWEDEWKKYLKVSRLSKFTIVPLVEEDGGESLPDHIYIIPGKAFGTGIHETTQLCVELLCQFVKQGDVVADIGTGSGILAIAAKKLGASEVFAVDNDREALENAVLNAERNCVSLQISCGNLANELNRSVQVVVANIIVKAVIELADQAKELLVKDGVYICSGIIQEEKQNVVDALLKKEFRILKIMDMEEWCAIAASPEI